MWWHKTESGWESLSAQLYKILYVIAASNKAGTRQHQAHLQSIVQLGSGDWREERGERRDHNYQDFHWLYGASLIIEKAEYYGTMVHSMVYVLRSNICNSLYLLSTNEGYQRNGKKSRDKNVELWYLNIELGRRGEAWLAVKWDINNIIIMAATLPHCHTALTGEQLTTKDNTKYLNVSSLALPFPPSYQLPAHINC